jgi:PrtD family type I secretion system ABC transporter
LLQSIQNRNRLPASPVTAALSACRGAFLLIGLFSGMINLLLLASSLFMLQVYDRVLPSRSLPTLVGLVILVLVLYSFQGLLELIRGRMLVRIGRLLDEKLSRRVYEAVVRLPLKTRIGSDGLQPLRDLDQVRSFLSSLGPAALFDLPWIPLYLGLAFAFHFLIGITAAAGAILLIALTVLTEFSTRAPTKAAAGFGATRLALAQASRSNAEVLEAMGITGRLAAVWSSGNLDYMKSQQRAYDVAGGLGGLSRVLRMMLQSGVLALGAYLVIKQEATAGVLIASTILVSRALAPVEIAIAHWRGFAGARQSWRRLSELISAVSEQDPALELPRPERSLSVEAIDVSPPGQKKFVVQAASFRLERGQGLGIIGPSASGKTSLARGLVGVWQPVRGKIRLDDAALDQWSREARGRHIGYLPQDVELFDGTITENVARFDVAPSSAAVIAAAKAAGVHELVLRLPEGYDTRIGEAGSALSAGQQQRIALARALYGEPFLVVLDEPNSNLDAAGEEALTHAILGVRARGGIVVVIAHRPSALAAIDLVLVMGDGKVQAIGPKDEVLAKVLRAPTAGPVRAPMPLRLVPEPGA